jgi:hypothetical protein
MVPFALLFTRREATNLAWAWYDTPDEPQLYDLKMTTVRWVYERFGHWVAAYYWFGFRNAGHGFESLFAQSAPKHWPEGEGHFTCDDFFLERTRIGPFLFVFGWQVYGQVVKRWPSGLEYRPKLTLKYRPLPVASTAK